MGDAAANGVQRCGIERNDEAPIPPLDTQSEADGVSSDGESDEDSGAFDRWRRESAVGAVGTGVARGLQAVFSPPVDEPVIVASIPGEPPGANDRVRVVLDPDDPTRAVAIVPEKSETSDTHST